MSRIEKILLVKDTLSESLEQSNYVDHSVNEMNLKSFLIIIVIICPNFQMSASFIKSRLLIAENSQSCLFHLIQRVNNCLFIVETDQ